MTLRPREFGAPMDVVMFRLSRRDTDPDEGYQIHMVGGASLVLVGLLLIGDAAHAMSPIGGVGVNLAVQDAVAAANLLTEPLRRARRDGTPVPESAAAAVQRRRWLPTVTTQAFQRLAQRFGIDRALRGGAPPDLSAIARLPVLSKPLSRLIGVGIRPEHVRVPAQVTPRTEP